MWEDDALELTMYQSGGAENKLGTGFIVLGKMRSRVIDWEPIDDRMNHPMPRRKLEQKFNSCPQRDVKIVIGDMNARIGREEMYKPVIGPNSLHTVTNDNGQRCINFAASHVVDGDDLEESSDLYGVLLVTMLD
ncbi:uncharacterized protein LOC119766278 [Culex quinquefasciatus]|uniref:uncharacterized protein LOC119766278 n=1 Tax=Culex quinquefasciatus TaxID=7176 RepID=UPI0018E332BF|nr:uncharacterized protein LOC119766278 [Culex quinquefasciatus]